MRTAFALYLLVALSAFAQSSRLEGRVVTVEGKPVPKATVRLNSRATAPAGQNTQPLVYVEVTSADGRFTVENIAPGTYTINAQRTGYSVPNSAALRPVPVTVGAGETRRGVEVKLVQFAIVSGIVTDADGDPVQGNMVRLLRNAYAQGRMTLQPVATATTDDRGQFRMSNVAEGRYYLAVNGSPAPPSGPVNEVRGRSALESNQTTYYPNSATIEGAAKLDIKSAALESLQIRLRRGMSYSIGGTVEMPGGAVNSVQIQVFSKGQDTTVQGVSVAILRPGQFRIAGLPPGGYTLFARNSVPGQTGNQPKVFAGRAEVTLGSADIDNVSIRLAEAGEISGNVAVEGASFVSYFSALPNNRPATPSPPTTTIPPNVRPPVRTPAIMLIAAENLPGSVSQSQVSEDGTFHILNVVPMQYMLTINNLPPGMYLKSARLGGQDVTRSLINLSSGASGPLEILLSPKAGSLMVAAIATADTPAGQGAMVSVWPVIPNRSSQTGGVNVLSSMSGNSRVQNLAPGDYFVAAWEDSPPAEMASIPDFLARFNDSAARVTVKEGETTNVEPRIISRDALKKILIDFP